MIKYKIPLAGLKESTNKIYAGQHWSKRKAFKDGVASIAALFCRPAQKFGPYPIELRYRFIFNSRALDTTNCSYLVKTLEDAFRSLEILENDDPKHVVRTIIEVVEKPTQKRKKGISGLGSQKNEENEDWVEITSTPCNYVSVDT